MKERPIETGMGFLRTLAGVYVIIIGSICIQAAHDAYEFDKKEAAIMNEEAEEYSVLLCNGKTFAIKSSEFDQFMSSDKQETIVIDALSKSVNQVVINKDDIEELNRFNSYVLAAQYIGELNNGYKTK